MSQYVATATKSFHSGAALAINRRVKLVSDVLQYAGAADVSIGVLKEATFANDAFPSGFTDVSVHLVSAQGTRKMVASGAITSGLPVYAAANGKVAGSGTVVEGIAMEAATADNDVIEVLAAVTSDAGSSVGGVAAGYALARGETALDGANPTPVATGLTTVIAFVAMLKGTAAPGVGTSVLTSSISGATGNVYAWKPTSADDTTLLASSGTESFYWIAVGT